MQDLTFLNSFHEVWDKYEMYKLVKITWLTHMCEWSSQNMCDDRSDYRADVRNKEEASKPPKLWNEIICLL